MPVNAREAGKDTAMQALKTAWRAIPVRNIHESAAALVEVAIRGSKHA